MAWFGQSNPPPPLPDDASRESTQQGVSQSLDAIEQILSTPAPLPVGGATEVTLQQVLQQVGADGVPPKPLDGTATGMIGFLRTILALLETVHSTTPGTDALRVEVVAGGGGGGGGPVTIADGDDVTQGAVADAAVAAGAAGTNSAKLRRISADLSALLTKVIAAPSTEAKQDAMIALLTAIAGSLAGTIAVSGGLTDAELRASPVPVSATALPLPTGASTEATLAAVLAKIIAAPATEAKQDTGNTALANILAKIIAAPATEAKQDALNALVTIMSEWDETDRAKVNIIAGQVGVAAGAGNSSASTQRVVIATDQAVVPVKLTSEIGKTTFSFYTNTSQTPSASSAEDLITFNFAQGTAAPTSGTSFVIPNGQTLRITSLTIEARGNNTATAQTSAFSLRVNTAGAITTGSTVMYRARVATPATANAVDRITITFPQGLDIVGDGTVEFGMTARSTYATNAPTWFVHANGFLFTTA